MKKKAYKILVPVIFLAGLSLLLYPFVANEWNTYRQSQLISSYEETVHERTEAGTVDYKAEWMKAQQYNEELIPMVLPDSFAIAGAEGEDEEYMAALNLAGDGIMGTVEIPRIGITLPIYHTTEERVLERAAGHLEGSSLPIGGKDTHAVISAHRGLPSAALFTDLDQLEIGNHFLIHVLDETLCYEVDQILTVEPDDTSALQVEDGEDLVTLLTCTPYGVNSHRLLVRGHRVPYEEAVLAEEETPLAAVSLHTNYLLWVFVGLGVTALVILVLFLIDRQTRKRPQKRRRRRKKRKETEQS